MGGQAPCPAVNEGCYRCVAVKCDNRCSVPIDCIRLGLTFSDEQLQVS